MTSRTRALLVAIVVCGHVVAGSAQSGVTPAGAGGGAARGFSPDRLRRITEMVDRRMAAKDIPGAVTLVAHRGTVVHFDARGVLDVESGRPMTKEALFQIASMTKPITATAILMLAEEGRLRLTDPLSTYLPEFKQQTVAGQGAPASRDVTIRDLLTHTSGMVAEPRFPDKPSLADFLPAFARVPLEFQPGTRWVYSNTVAFDLLARVVEVVSGEPYDRFLRNRIFMPLGMKDTLHHPDAARMSRVATRYEVTHTGLRPREATDVPTYFGGGWGLRSTAADYLRFAQMLLNGGELEGTRILSRQAVGLLRGAHVPDTMPGRPAGEGFGLAVRVVTDAAARGSWLSNGSFGWSGAAGTHFWVDPEKQIVAILMIAAPASGIRPDFETAVMQAFVGN